MSDNKYINTYVDIAIGTIHEYLTTNIQLKTQNKIANDLISEKDKVIASLQADVSRINKENLEMDMLRKNAKNWEDSYNVMKAKVAHMDTLNAQLFDFKKEISAKDEKIKQLEDKLVELNKKNKSKQPVVSQIKTEAKPVKPVVVSEKVKETKPIMKQLPTDDF